MTKRLTKLVALLLVAVMCASVLTACPEKKDPVYVWEDDGKNYTYNTFTSISPSNWNELTYQDNNDTQMMGYIASSFYRYDFKFDENGEIVPGGFEMKYGAATGLEDVTAQYAEAWGLDADGKGLAYKITFRDDLCWENGDKITADSFIYSMKEQLNPLFQNYRADSFYIGSTVIHGAKDYAKQGLALWDDASLVYDYDEYDESLDSNLKFSLAPADGALGATTQFRKFFVDYYGAPVDYPTEKAYAYLGNNVLGFDISALEGKLLSEIKADATLNSIFTTLHGAFSNAFGFEMLDWFLTYYEWPATDWSQVGFFKGANDLELIVILDKPLDLLSEDGSLSYRSVYNFSGFPLVHQATYEACKQAPTGGSSLWTSTYNSDAETTMSWGPYKLESFETGKQYVFVRNEKWYGYGLEEYEGQYLTDKIVCETISDYEAAFAAFEKGELDGIGIAVTKAEAYKNSSRAYFTPDDYVNSVQLQSNKAALKERESEGVNKTILSYVDFRKALSLGLNRTDYAQKCTTSSLAGYGLFNSMHYYDVENGKAFRESDEAKKVLCNIYAVDYTKYPTLDDAVAAITGYNLVEARALVTKAYNEALAAGDIKEGDKVVLTYGTSTDSPTVRIPYDYLNNAWKELMVGTPLEGKFELDFDSSFGNQWANKFRAGAYDICQGGWTGAAWDPGYFLLAYLSPDYMYSKAWDTSSVMMEFTMVGVGENGEDITETMSLIDWYYCLNGEPDAKYDWSSTALEESQRLQLIAALEQEVLKVYYTVPITYSFAASMLSYKIDYITYEYNTFMSYGGMRYMKYNYTDEEWAAAVAEQGGTLDYTR